jgi:hypothetical protein
LWINKKTFHSLRWRIAIAYLILIGIGFVVTNLTILKLFENRQIHDKKERFRAYAVQVAQVISFYRLFPVQIHGSSAILKDDFIFVLEGVGLR